MDSKMLASEMSLGDIFDGSDSYVVPAFQRPYMWKATHAQTLFEDLRHAHKTERNSGYFLGSIVLTQDEDNGQAKNEWQIIDGQQRLTTLTMLLATVAHLLTDAQKQADLRHLILHTGNSARNVEDKPRLSLREMDRDFFADYVQGRRLNDLLALQRADLHTDAQERIQKNCEALHNVVKKEFCGGEQDADTALFDFGKFWIHQCHLVVFRTPSQSAAFRVFSVLNSRGLNLRASDLLKAEIMGGLPRAQRNEFSRKWEEAEARVDNVSNGGIDGLLSHIRMIQERKKSRRILLDDVRGFLPRDERELETYMDRDFLPLANAYLTAKNANYKADKRDEDLKQKINHLLDWLNSLNNSDWLPPAIAFLARGKNTPEQTLRFFTQLERLAAFLLVCRKNDNQRISAYADVLYELRDKRASFDNVLAAMDLEPDMAADMMKALNGDIYNMPPHRRGYIVCRLESFMAGDHAFVASHPRRTIEHVLPQTIPADSKWEQWWPNAEAAREQMHRIANLVLLGKSRNASASNFEFGKKKSAYFAGSTNVPNYALTGQVMQEKEWTPAIVEKRQKALMAVFAREWRLGEGGDSGE